jgi:cytochrome c oxidase cbb3-type subunit IV
MDLNDMRVIVTVLSFATFLGIVFWAYSGRRKSAFDRAARSVLEEEEDGNGKAGRGGMA